MRGRSSSKTVHFQKTQDRFPGNQSSSRNAKSIVKTVFSSTVASPSISGNIILGSCHRWRIKKVSPISFSSIESKEEIKKLKLHIDFETFFFTCCYMDAQTVPRPVGLDGLAKTGWPRRVGRYSISDRFFHRSIFPDIERSNIFEWPDPLIHFT